MAIRLDNQFLKSVAPTDRSQIYYCDTVPGFGLRVTPNGAKAFVLNYRTRSGRERRYTIGQFPGVSIAAARKRAGELKAQIREGADPLQSIHDERQAPTVADLCKRFEEEHLGKKRASTRKDYKTAIELAILPAWRHRKVADITVGDVDALHRRITERGSSRGRAAPYQANRVAAVVSKMFSLAIRWGWRPGIDPPNPVKGLERNTETKRKRYLQAPELGALLATLAERDAAARGHGKRKADRSSDIVRLLLLTGARSGEVMSATWGQFNLEEGKWTKPAASSKQKAEHSVPLSAPARKLLADMRERLDASPSDNDPLFPGRGTAAPQGTLKKSWRKIVERATVLYFASRADEPDGKLVAQLARSLDRNPTLREVGAAAQAIGVELPTGLRDLRPHDLRHSYASILASSGSTLLEIGALLGHSQPATTARYSHLFSDPLRKATERVGEIIAGADKPSAQVIPIKGVL
jgi:integrase